MLRRKFFGKALAIAAIGATVLVTGCASSVKKEESLVTVSYRIADRLAHVYTNNAGEDISQPIMVSTATSIDNLQKSSTFGRSTTEMVASRLVQLEFNVSDVRLRNAMAMRDQGELMLSRQAADVAKSKNAYSVLAGTYSVMNGVVYVNFKLIRVADGAILASVDEAVPYAE